MINKTTANIEIKRINHSNIFHLLCKHDGLTKQDIVTTLKLSLPTVAQNVAELETQGLIGEAGTQGNTGGRRAKKYSIVKDSKLAFGLDITQNHVTVVVVDLTGDIIYHNRNCVKFEQTDGYYRFLGDKIREIAKELELPDERILGVGIAVPGLVTEDNRRVFYGEILRFTGSTCEEFSKYIPYPTALLNDANAAGFAESWARPEMRTSFYLMLSNNIGGSVIFDGKTYPGQNLHSSEVGHICLDRAGPKCYCGQTGCVDCYLAATVLSGMTDGVIGDFFKLLKTGDAAAAESWDRYLNDLAFTVNTLYILFDCTIILGGYVGGYLDDYLDEIKRRASSLNSFEDNADYLCTCLYKTEAIAAGAALHFISGFLESI